MLTEADFRCTVVDMLRRAETTLPKDVIRALMQASMRERGRVARLQFGQMFRNLELARKLSVPICQDTGTFTFFVRIGTDIRLQFNPEKVITEAVEVATCEVPLRVSIVDPITREPCKSNTGRAQPSVHIELSEGKGIQADLLIKGAGTENCGRLFMAGSSEGLTAVERSVLEVLREVRGRPCPPNIVGVGVGGSMETAPLLAKRALLRRLDRINPDPVLARLERRTEIMANDLRTGPMGLGGRTTLLRLLVEKAACHTASLPIAVALQCWPARRARARVIEGKFKVVEP